MAGPRSCPWPLPPPVAPEAVEPPAAAEPLPALLDSLVRDVVEFTGTPVFEDDVCLLGVGYAGK